MTTLPSTTPTTPFSISSPCCITVIGGGVIGLSSALCLLQDDTFRCVPCHVRIISDKWTPYTTSDGAGALWELREEPHRIWATNTFKHYESFLQSTDSTVVSSSVPLTSTTAPNLPLHEKTGIAYCDGIQWLREKEDDFLPKDVVPWYERVTPDELRHMNESTGNNYTDGWKYRSIIVDSPSYLRYLMTTLTNINNTPDSLHTVEFITRKIVNIQELLKESDPSSNLSLSSSSIDILINATGLGSFDLVNDPMVYPIRGQTIRVYAPHIQTWTCAQTVPEGSLTYILPRRTSGWVVCGGTYETNDDDTTTLRKNTALEIWKRCVTINPALNQEFGTTASGSSTDRIEDESIFTVSADKLVHWTGLRPGRTTAVRLDVEIRKKTDILSKETIIPYQREHHLLLVNNYGHGGCGHSLHWGCAMNVVQRITDILLGPKKP